MYDMEMYQCNSRGGALPSLLLSWKFLPNYTTSNWALEGGNNNELKAVARTAAKPLENPEAFSGIINGKMTRPGGESGSPATWSLAGFQISPRDKRIL